MAAAAHQIEFVLNVSRASQARGEVSDFGPGSGDLPQLKFKI
jgi:hypothetical protein